MKDIQEQHPQNIPGYGMDIDLENEPNYPMKNYTGDDHKRLDYPRSEQQEETVELLKSTERPSLPAVFGTSVPPSGLSGMIRRYAFQHSEDRVRHWIPLILADRINVVEGILEDLGNGIVPNILNEKGITADWTYNRKDVLKKAAVAAVAITVISLLWSKKYKKLISKI